MRGTRSPATTNMWKRGRASPDGRSQPRVNTRCRSETIQSSTSSVIILLAVLLGQTLHPLNERIVVCLFPRCRRRTARQEVRTRPHAADLVNERASSPPQVRQRNLVIAIPPG